MNNEPLFCYYDLNIFVLRFLRFCACCEEAENARERQWNRAANEEDSLPLPGWSPTSLNFLR